MRAPAVSLSLLLVILSFGASAFAQEPTAMLHMQDHEYLPTRLEVAVGATVTAMNFGEEPHTVTAVERSLFDVQNIPPGGEERTFTAPTTPGEYPFYCIYHATPRTTPEEGMAGVLVVLAPSPAGPTSAAEPTPGSPRTATHLPAALLILALAMGAWVGRRR